MIVGETVKGICDEEASIRLRDFGGTQIIDYQFSSSIENFNSITYER